MVQYVITPWRNRQELLHIRDLLYPEKSSTVEGANRAEQDVDERKMHAVANVSVWVQRGNCPHLVESTAILMSAVLNDVPGNSTYCVRAAYAAAFCRFVTGLLDSHQDKRRKMSMYAIAKSIGLPATYVELRHQATHEELPSLSKLRGGAQKALKWIWDYYWINLTEAKHEVENDDCKALVAKYASARNKRSQRMIEILLGKWNEDRIMSALMDAQGKTKDAESIMQLIRLQERIMSGNEAPIEDKQDIQSKNNSLDEVRAEVAAMEKEMRSLEQDGPPRKRQKGGSTEESNGSGWALWQGPWIPKPIGIV